MFLGGARLALLLRVVALKLAKYERLSHCDIPLFSNTFSA